MSERMDEGARLPCRPVGEPFEVSTVRVAEGATGATSSRCLTGKARNSKAAHANACSAKISLSSSSKRNLLLTTANVTKFARE